MIRISFFSAAVAILMLFCQGWSAHAAGPEDQLVEAVKVALGKNFNTDWSGLDALPGIKWAPLPPTGQIWDKSNNCSSATGWNSLASRLVRTSWREAT
jgi:hypothetical protein